VVLLTGLEASTRYHYRVFSADASGNISEKVGGEFTTTARPDLSSPVITRPSGAIDIGQTMATVVWGTDEPANSEVIYSLSPDLTPSFFAADPAYTTEHRVALTNLISGTIYYFQVQTTDMRGNGPTFG
jgi:phosphodiesterase/alkaline phosphatase D-like protein